MISTNTAKIINILPDKFVTYISKKIVDQYLKKICQYKNRGRRKLKGNNNPYYFYMQPFKQF